MDDTALSASDSRDRPRPALLRRASINLAQLASIHPPVFSRTATAFPRKYNAEMADDLIVNQDVYYKPRPEVRIPIVHREGLEHLGFRTRNGRTKSGESSRTTRSKTARTIQQPSNLSREIRGAAPVRQATIAGLPNKKSTVRSTEDASGTHNADDVKYDLTLSAEWSHLLALMKKLKGVIRGWAKWQTQNSRGSGYCYTEEFSGALLFEEKESVVVLMNDLRGCKVSLSPSSTTAIHVRSSKDPNNCVVIDPQSSADFSRWLAVLLSWTPLRAAGVSSKLMRFRYPQLDFSAPSATTRLTDEKSSDKMDTTPVTVRTIKVGQVDMWDPTLKRARKGKQIVTSAHYWVPASCLLKTNGELQVFPDIQSTQSMSTSSSSGTEYIYNNPLANLSSNNLGLNQGLAGSWANGSQVIFQLSTIRRSAIQKADPSLTGRDNCIVIFLKTPAVSFMSPNLSHTNLSSSSNQSQSSSFHQSSYSMHHQHQYGHHQSPSLLSTTSLVDVTQSGNRGLIVTPIYLSFDSRMNFEVWFVLLRSLSLPELYGPDTGRVAGSFRQQRILNVRIIDGKVLWPRGPAMKVESTIQSKSMDSYVDVELNDKVRARTRVKYGTSKPFWREDFSFPDLPFLVNSVKLNLKQRNKKTRDLQSDATVGEVRMLISDIQKDSDLERWIPIYNPARGYMGKTGEICVKMQVSEFTILASYEYDYMLDLLLDFRNRLTIQLADVTGDLKRLSNALLDIYQASGQVTDWLIALAEDEINDTGTSSSASNVNDKMTESSEPKAVATPTLSSTSSSTSNSTSTSTPTSRAPSSGTRKPIQVTNPSCPSGLGPTSNSCEYSQEGASSGSSTVSPGTLTPNSLHGNSHENLPPSRSSSANLASINSAAIADANLLFRGNSLLTKSLDAHMRRIGHDYIKSTLADVIRRIVAENADCEVDPSRLDNPETLDAHWARLDSYMLSIWDRIRHSAKQCPPGLRRIFHNIRLNIENRFGEFLSASWYSGVSGFLFLRFFCPAVLSPKLFGLMQDHPPACSQRTLTLLAKGLQGLANRAQFGTKEPWMAPMNKFLNSHIQEFREFISEVSTWRSKIYTHDPPLVHYDEVGRDLQDDNEAEANRRSLSMVPYQIPNTILSRLPPAFRDSAPSLPFLIDRPAALAELVDIWLQWYDTKVALRTAQKATAAAAAAASSSPSSKEYDIESSNDGHRSSTSSMPNTIEGMPDQYTDDSDDLYYIDEDRTDDESVDRERDVEYSEGEGQPVRSKHVEEEEDTPSGVLFTGALLMFHRECVRIRNEIQKLRYKSSIPEIPSEVPPETWEYYVTHFLDTSEFHFVRRGSVLKSLFLGGVSGGRNDSSSKDEDYEERARFEHGDDEYSYFPAAEPQPTRPSFGDSRWYSMPPDVATREGSGKSAGSGSSDSSLGGTISTVSKGIGSISKKSKSLKLPAWRKLLGSSSSGSSRKEK
ncbi:hypothetical protein V1517DRAFT_324472 [Lipomyces orientalis]|uniref:Uncharacterized protein n=1 Tax=Lipomyces orientalis TaxID=1233043 RepID=A0ACC3TMF4_9ASCO